MATIAPLIVGTGDIKTVKFRWLGMANGDDGASMDLPEIYNSSCLFPIELCSTTTTGVVRGGAKIAHG